MPETNGSPADRADHQNGMERKVVRNLLCCRLAITGCHVGCFIVLLLILLDAFSALALLVACHRRRPLQWVRSSSAKRKV